jgi:hypothetical protein
VNKEGIKSHAITGGPLFSLFPEWGDLRDNKKKLQKSLARTAVGAGEYK